MKLIALTDIETTDSFKFLKKGFEYEVIDVYSNVMRLRCLDGYDTEFKIVAIKFLPFFKQIID